MDRSDNSKAKLLEEIRGLKEQVQDANDVIHAIRTGQIDALVTDNGNGHQLFTLRSADMAYRVFFERMNEGAVTLNHEGLILYCNLKFSEMLRQQMSKVIGENIENFIAPDQREAFQICFQQGLTKDCKTEMRLVSEHSTVEVLLSLTAIELESGHALSMVVTDLSLQKDILEKLKKSNNDLAQSNRALELSNHDLQQFASVASHDLQEPLRKIGMFASILKNNEGAFPENMRANIDKIMVSAARMKTLIIDVLDYSKLSADHNHYEVIDLNEVLQVFLDDFELNIKDKNATIRVDKLTSLEGNRGQMRQVFQNLLSNALKFSKENTAPEINITCIRLKEKSFQSPPQEDGPYCLVSISDNGIGFDEKYLGKIFDLFERLFSKQSYEGTGIGLAITKKIIEKHHGLIEAKSKEGQGSEFRFILPIRQ